MLREERVVGFEHILIECYDFGQLERVVTVNLVGSLNGQREIKE